MVFREKKSSLPQTQVKPFQTTKKGLQSYGAYSSSRGDKLDTSTQTRWTKLVKCQDEEESEWDSLQHAVASSSDAHDIFSQALVQGVPLWQGWSFRSHKGQGTETPTSTAHRKRSQLLLLLTKDQDQKAVTKIFGDEDESDPLEDMGSMIFDGILGIFGDQEWRPSN